MKYKSYIYQADVENGAISVIAIHPMWLVYNKKTLELYATFMIRNSRRSSKTKCIHYALKHGWKNFSLRLVS